ncbi:hypothetical protein QBC46DRAFT_339409 [Diplogelasinospora grovesii]|uniref:ATP-dependent RNA helicase n=1 Tax=Diplogelasinospora grovesii TaxID=303347 RepID=A0AAN6NB19_9PEZI|nr:hypothetical protein QBC46DRAFT_339409 [Diplogelasinospora grovesii]
MESNRASYGEMAGRLQPQLLQALEKMEYTHMTPVQQKMLQLPRFTDDCLVQAKTGTGKTIAFLLPALQTLLTTKGLARGQVGLLVLAPTRELAQQIVDECDKLTSLCKPPLECHVAVGGSNKASHLNKFLKGKPTILVATPGRLNDYLSDPAVKERFGSVRCVVLDEADRMLDQGFLPALTTILKSLPDKAAAGWQGMCFSATMPPSINKVLHMVLKPNHLRLSTIDENEVPTVEAVPQSLITVNSIQDVLPTLHTLLSCEQMDNPDLKAVVFSSTARHAGLLYQIFGEGGASPGGLPVFQMNSRMAQGARNKTVQLFKEAERGLLFASDVVGRGMDFPNIGLVVQVGLPLDSEQYVHRVGRTGRAGKVGRAVMVLIPEEMGFIKRNPKFPIKPTEITHPRASTIPSADIVQAALARVSDTSKTQAYVAYIGFTRALSKVMGLDARGVVHLSNRFSESIGCDEPPALEASTIGKMGLKGVPGLTIKRKTGGNQESGDGRKGGGAPGGGGRRGRGGGAGGGPPNKRPRRGDY